MLSFEEIVFSDHRSYVIDVNLEEYFEDTFSSWDKIDKVLLNPSRKSHQEKFCKVIEEQLDMYQLENQIHRIAQCPTKAAIECVDETITRTFNNARKKVEGMKRGILYSAEKARVRDTILYWKAYIRRNRGGIVDVEVMNKRKEMHQIIASGEESMEEASQKL